MLPYAAAGAPPSKALSLELGALVAGGSTLLP